MPKALIIFNPVAGLNSPFDVPEIIRDALTKKDYDYTWFETQPVSHQPLEQFLGKHFDLIIAVGGDGTVRDTAAFMAKNKIKTPLAIVPQGTGNLLALSLDIPLFPPHRAINFALKEKAKPLDMLLVNREHYALLGAGQGYDAMSLKETTRKMKRKFGMLAYLFSFLRTFFIHLTHPYKIVVDGEHFQTAGKTALVLNVMSITGVPFGKDISPSDGKLNLIIMNPRSLWDFLKIGLLYPFKRKGERVPKLQCFCGSKISISQRGGKYIQMDGEVIKAKTLQTEVIPRAINVIYAKEFLS